MIRQLLAFECYRLLSSRVFQIFYLVLAASLFTLVHVLAGMFDFFGISFSQSIHINDASLIRMMVGAIQYLAIFIVAAINHMVLMKDFDHQCSSLSFTSGVSRFNFLVSKYLSVIFCAMLMVTAPLLGHLIGCSMPYIDQQYLQPVNLIFYFDPFIKILLPNVIYFGSLFFAVSLAMRHNLANLILALVLYFLVVLSGHLYADFDTKTLGALLDPIGQKAISLTFVDINSMDQAERTIPMSEIIIWNRILWGTIIFSLLAVVYWRFNFQLKNENKKKFKLKLNSKTEQNENIFSKPSARIVFNFSSLNLSKWLSGISFELSYVIKNRYFLLLVILSAGLLWLTNNNLGHLPQTTTHPLTYLVIEHVIGKLSPLFFLFIAFQAGELMHRERLSNCAEVQQSLPVDNVWKIGTKVGALIIAGFLLSILMIASGIFLQWIKGYHNYEINQYLTSILGLEFVNVILVSFLAVAVNQMIHHRFLALFILLTYFLCVDAGITFSNHHLTNYGSSPEYIYSDLNGYGENLYPYLLFKTYWLVFGGLLLILGNLFWQPLQQQVIKERIAQAKTRWARVKAPVFMCLVILSATASYILYNT